MRVAAPSARQAALASRYDGAASRWQSKIDTLGYPAAYISLVRRALGTATSIQDYRVLDAGTGCGDFVGALAQEIGRPQSLHLMDISPEMLKQARALLERLLATPSADSSSPTNLKTSCAAIEQMNVVEEYDLILCAHVVEHCDDHVAALRRLQLALRPGGRLLLVASKPHWCTALIRLIWSNTAFRPKKMCALLEEVGFSPVANFGFAKGPPSRTSWGYLATKA